MTLNLSLCFIIAFLWLLFTKINVSETYLLRIINVIQNLTFNELLIVEPSLGSRINSYYNSFRIFLDNPILGIGLGNSKYYIANYFETSQFGMTLENYVNLQASYITGKMSFNGAYLWEYLSEVGIIGTALFYTFFVKCIEQLQKIKLLNNLYSHFALAISNSLIILLSCL